MNILLILGSPAYLFILYVLYIQHERGGPWRLFVLFGVLGWPLDFFLNYTFFAAAFMAWPERGAYTFSRQLAYLQHRNGWRGEIARPIAALLNAIAPSGTHIKRVA